MTDIVTPSSPGVATRPPNAAPRPRARLLIVSATRTELKDIGYEIFIGALSLLSIFNLVLDRASPAGRATWRTCC